MIYHIQIVENFENKSESGSSSFDDLDIELVREAKKNVFEPQDYSYSERDVILYNLSIGATEQELCWTFENHEEFSALPAFGVIPQFVASSGISLDFLPNFNPVRTPLTFGLRIWHPVLLVFAHLHWLTRFFIDVKAKLLHGEQFLSIKAPIPTSGDLVNETRYVGASSLLLHYGGLFSYTWVHIEAQDHRGPRQGQGRSCDDASDDQRQEDWCCYLRKSIYGLHSRIRRIWWPTCGQRYAADEDPEILC